MKKPVSIISQALTSLLMAAEGDSTRINRKKKEARPCLHCGTLHTHNNAYCSSECCRAGKGIKS